jgi:hypothetical protein
MDRLPLGITRHRINIFLNYLRFFKKIVNQIIRLAVMGIRTLYKEALMRYGFNHLSDDEFVVLCKELNKNKGLLLIGAIKELPPKLAAFAEWRQGLSYMAAYA